MKKTKLKKEKITVNHTQCNSCHVFNAFNEAIANYHKLTLEKRYQMVRDLTTQENINLN